MRNLCTIFKTHMKAHGKSEKKFTSKSFRKYSQSIYNFNKERDHGFICYNTYIYLIGANLATLYY